MNAGEASGWLDQPVLAASDGLKNAILIDVSCTYRLSGVHSMGIKLFRYQIKPVLTSRDGCRLKFELFIVASVTLINLYVI